MMSLALYVVGCIYTFVGVAVLFERCSDVVGGLFCLTGVVAFSSGILADAISSIKRENEEEERRRKERGENG